MVTFKEGELATPGALFWAVSWLTNRVSLTVPLSVKVMRYVHTPYMDISAIVHTHGSRAVVYNDNPIVDVSNGMRVTLLDLALRRASSLEFLGARSS